MSNKKSVIIGSLRAAFPHTIPIMAGFIFLGITYGIYMKHLGFSFIYPMLMSLTIFAGSMEFVAADMLTGMFNPLQAFIMTIMVNARHLFYGISMLDKYKNTGKKKAYLIFGLCDETFSINYSAIIPSGAERSWFYFFVTLLDHMYWFFGATIGGLFASLITFNTDGIEFAMTSMFIVIFLDQWMKEKNHTSALIGVAVSLISLILIGPDNFIIPAMICILAILAAISKPLSKKLTIPDDTEGGKIG